MAEELNAVTWRKPGVLEVVVSRKYLTREGDSGGAVSLKGLFSGNVDFRLVETEIRVEGAHSIKFFKYQGGVKLASPSAVDGPLGESEVWSASVVMFQRDLVRHPRLREILAAGKGGLFQGKVVWPPMVEVESEEESGFMKNPFYGLSSYLSPRVEVTREAYLDEGKISASSLAGIGWLDNAMDHFDFMIDERFILGGRSISRARGGRVVRTTWISDESFVDPVYKEDWDG